MKKIFALFSAAALLTGCGMYAMEEAEEPEQTETEEGEERAKIAFKLQNSDRQVQMSPLNDEALKVLSDRVHNEELEPAGEAGEVTVAYSGAYLTLEDGTKHGVFLITNRTNTDMTNLEIKLTIENTEERTLVDYPLYLADEHFGILEQDTAMPLYIHFDTDEEEQLSKFIDPEQVEISTEIISYERAEEEAETDQEEQTEGHKKGWHSGYHPTYTEAVLSQEKLNENIASGKVPELKLLTPPVMSGQEGAEVMAGMDEEMLNTARGLSIEEEMNLFWTGITQQTVETGSYRTIFLAGNRTGEDYRNLEMALSFGDSEGNIFLDNAAIALPEAEYGVSENESLLPLYVEIPAESQEVFKAFLEDGANVQPFYEIASFDGEKIQ